jgi:hypothetical protein
MALIPFAKSNGHPSMPLAVINMGGHGQFNNPGKMGERFEICDKVVTAQLRTCIEGAQKIT